MIDFFYIPGIPDNVEEKSRDFRFGPGNIFRFILITFSYTRGVYKSFKKGGGWGTDLK